MLGPIKRNNIRTLTVFNSFAKIVFKGFTSIYGTYLFLFLKQLKHHTEIKNWPYNYIQKLNQYSMNFICIQLVTFEQLKVEVQIVVSLKYNVYYNIIYVNLFSFIFHNILEVLTYCVILLLSQPFGFTKFSLILLDSQNCASDIRLQQ